MGEGLNAQPRLAGKFVLTLPYCHGLKFGSELLHQVVENRLEICPLREAPDLVLLNPSQSRGDDPSHLHPAHRLRVQDPGTDEAGGHQLLDGRIGPVPVELKVGPGFQGHVQEAGPLGCRRCGKDSEMKG